MAHLCKSGKFWQMSGPVLAGRRTTAISRTVPTTAPTYYYCNPSAASHFRVFSSSPSHFPRNSCSSRSFSLLPSPPSTPLGCMSSRSLDIIRNFVTHSSLRLQSKSPTFIVNHRNYLSSMAKGIMSGPKPPPLFPESLLMIQIKRRSKSQIPS